MYDHQSCHTFSSETRTIESWEYHRAEMRVKSSRKKTKFSSYSSRPQGELNTTFSMPYWPSSRVGAVPQEPSSNSKNKKRVDKLGRKKGITMEVRQACSVNLLSITRSDPLRRSRGAALGEKTVVNPNLDHVRLL